MRASAGELEDMGKRASARVLLAWRSITAVELNAGLTAEGVLDYRRRVVGNPSGQRDLHQFVEEVVEEVYNKRNFGHIRQAFAEDLTNHTAPSELAPGREGYELYVAFVMRSYSDMSVTADDIVVEGNTIVLRWTLRGTLNDTFDPPYRGKRVEVPGCTVECVGDDGKITDIWNYVNDLQLLGQLGIPVPKAPIPSREEGRELIRQVSTT